MCNKTCKNVKGQKREPVQVNNLTPVMPQQQAMPLLSVTEKAPNELPPMPQLQRMGTFNYTQELSFNEISGTQLVQTSVHN